MLENGNLHNPPISPVRWLAPSATPSGPNYGPPGSFEDTSDSDGNASEVDLSDYSPVSFLDEAEVLGEDHEHPGPGEHPDEPDIEGVNCKRKESGERPDEPDIEGVNCKRQEPDQEKVEQDHKTQRRKQEQNTARARDYQARRLEEFREGSNANSSHIPDGAGGSSRVGPSAPSLDEPRTITPLGYDNRVGRQPVRSLMLVTVPPGGDQTPGNNEGDDWYDQHNLEGVGLSELSAEQLARHTKRENGSDFPIRPSRNETMEEGHHHHHCPGCINEECPGVTAEPGAHYQGARGNQNGKSTVRKPPHLATQHSRRDLKRRREDLERAEQELADAEEREDRDNQNWATHIRKEQENEAWHTAHEEWADQFKGRYLMTDDKIPSDDEPTDLRLTEEEYKVRRRRHQRFCEILFALRREYVDRSYEEEQVRHLIHLHENEVWKRGDGEWRTRFHKLLDRLHRIGVEQLRINERIAALSTLAASMAAAEDAQKMANQAMEAVQRAQNAELLLRAVDEDGDGKEDEEEDTDPQPPSTAPTSKIRYM